MGIQNRSSSRYIFSPPYDRDSRLVANPLYTTTHETSYPYHNNGRYAHIASKYKQCTPFIKSPSKNVYRGKSKSFRSHIHTLHRTKGLKRIETYCL